MYRHLFFDVLVLRNRTELIVGNENVSARSIDCCFYVTNFDGK